MAVKLFNVYVKTKNFCFGGNKSMVNQRTRYGQRSKKRKTNIILNSLIGVVLLLIIFVSANIFLGNDKEQTSIEENSETENNESQDIQDEESTEENDESPVDEGKDSPEKTDTEEETIIEEEPTNEEESTVEGETPIVEENEPTAGQGQEVITEEGGSSPNVIRTIVNPAWEPVGTVQQGEHYNVYDGVDWDEMVKAISYATNLEEENMTIKFLGNNGHNKSVGTVYSKNKEEIYKVYIEWVDNEGWKPTKVEELATIE